MSPSEGGAFELPAGEHRLTARREGGWLSAAVYSRFGTRLWLTRIPVDPPESSKAAFVQEILYAVGSEVQMRELLAMTVLQVACATMTYTHGVPNLHKVEEGVWRGGQPTTEGFRYLRDTLKVHTVVKLNYSHEGSDLVADQLGMNLIEIPMPPSELEDLFKGPLIGEVEKAVGAIAIAKPGGVYVHCSHGHDRTGLIVGEYRILANKWERARAWDEMIKLGFHRELFGLVDVFERMNLAEERSR